MNGLDFYHLHHRAPTLAEKAEMQSKISDLDYLIAAAKDQGTATSEVMQAAARCRARISRERKI